MSEPNNQPIMRKRWRPWIASTILVGAVVFGVLVAEPVRRGVAMLAPPNAEAAMQKQVEDGDGLTLYQSGMHPWIITTEPGNCPICGMKLEPIDPAKLTGQVTIDPTVVQNLGVRTAEVQSGPLTRTVRTVGTVEVAEPLVRDVNLRVSGWIESLAVDFVGARVEAGDELFTVYSPELYAAQEELLLATQSGGGAGADMLIASARDRLLNFGLTETQVEGIVASGEAKRRMPILSPHAGIVLDKHANEGMRVDPGMRVFRIGDLSTVWVQATMYEFQLPFVELGLPATVTLPAEPGSTYNGEVVFVDPIVDPQTRSVRVRVAITNEDGRLKPGMFAEVTLTNTLSPLATLAAREAILDTGVRSVSFVSLGQGRFEPREVVVGFEAEEGLVEVLSGLSPGERVVTSGQFLLDSEASVRASLARMVGTNSEDSAATQTPVLPKAEAMDAGLSAEAQTQIDNVATAYLAIQDGLTNDTLQNAHAHLAAIREAAMHVGHLAPDEVASLAEPVGTASQIATDDLESFREGFGPLSDAVIALLTAAPPTAAVTPDDGKVYVTHCPMVNQDWLQVGTTVRNPYATDMLNCGSIERELPSAPTPEAPSDNQNAR